MSGLRVAAFSKYFAMGMLCTSVVCGRHAAYLSTANTEQVGSYYDSIARYAESVIAMEDYLRKEHDVKFLQGTVGPSEGTIGSIMIGKRVVKVPAKAAAAAASTESSPDTGAAAEAA